jgi:hypothetical protein
MVNKCTGFTCNIGLANIFSFVAHKEDDPFNKLKVNQLRLMRVLGVNTQKRLVTLSAKLEHNGR